VTDPLDQDPPAAAPLPKEGDRRIVEDADARGLVVVLQGGESWYVAPMPLSPRGERIAALVDQLEGEEVDALAAQRGENSAEARLLAAETDADIETARGRLQGAAKRRREANAKIATLHREIAFHALRSHYRLTREEVGLLVTQRHWQDVVNALHGRDTMESQRRLALDLMERMAAITGGGRKANAEVPFVQPSASASGGGAPS
jgi:hypothetical protein